MNTEITDEIIDYVFNRKAPIRSFRDVAKAKSICEMRAAGFTYEEIGKEFNLSPTRARQYVVRTMGIYRHRREKDARSEKIKIIKVKQGTNYDKIRNMSIDEMAESSIPFFGCPYDTPYVGCTMGEKFNDDCIKCTKAWLESEVEE